MIALIMSIALQFGLPPHFVVSIAMAENPQMNARAININQNGTKDRGLMQLNDCWFTDDDWADPVVNISAACEHILMLRARSLNWWQVAIAYNCGIARVYSPPQSSVAYAAKVMEKWQELDPYNLENKGGR